VEDLILAQVRKLILKYLESYSVCVYLYGSRAKGTDRKTSDVDIAILPVKPIPEYLLAELRERLEESNIPYEVEIIDLSKVSNEFRQAILPTAILWKDCTKESKLPNKS
jgi:predicted nucleotidyltransferase